MYILTPGTRRWRGVCKGEGLSEEKEYCNIVVL